MQSIESNPRNTAVLRSLSQLHPGTAAIASPEDTADPYLGCGSHPDIVERVWDQLGRGYPRESRKIVYGTPALIDAESGLILAVAFGTSYCIRLPADLLRTAQNAGCASSHRWSNGKLTDLSVDFGPDWLFGCWATDEETWIRSHHNHPTNNP